MSVERWMEALFGFVVLGEGIGTGQQNGAKAIECPAPVGFLA